MEKHHRHVLWCASALALFLVSQVVFGQAQFCNPPSYVSRSSSLPKPPSWKVAGSYDSFTTTLGLGSFAADINGDGRLELLSAGVPGTTWQAIGYAPRNQSYEIVHSARLPYAFGLHDGGAGAISAGTLSSAAGAKIFSNNPLQIFDQATQKLELVSDSSFGNGRIYTADLNHDGKTELVGDGGVVADSGLTHFLSSGMGDGSFLGHFDSASAYEMVGTTGALYQWQGSTWTKTADLGIQSDHDIVAAAGDLNGDGFDDFVYESNSTLLTAYDFANKKVLWQITATSAAGTSVNAIRGIAIADANGDGKPDVLVVTDGTPGGDEGEVRAYDGLTGKELWYFQHPDGVGSGIFVGKFDDSPGQEIVFGTFRPVTGPARIWVYDLATRALKFEQRQEGGPVRAMAIGDFTPDAGNEVIVAPTATIGDGDTIFHVRNFASMAPITDISSANLPTPSADGVQALAFGDVIGDSKPELVVGTDDSNGVSSVYVYSWPDRRLLQTFTLDPGTVVVDLAIGDLNNTGQNQIVAATAFKDTRSTGTRLYILDAHTGTTVFSSGDLFPQYGITSGLLIADLYGDGHPKIIASGQDIAIIDGGTHQITHIPGTVYFGFDIVDADGDGILDIVGGSGAVNGGNIADAGHIVVLKGPSWTKSLDLKVCDNYINAVRWNSLNTSRRQVFYTCDTQLGMVDLDSQTWQTVSEPTAVDLGLENHLFLVATPSGDPRLIASGQWGAYSFVQTPNLAPYISPTNVCQPGLFATHWGKDLEGALNYFDADGDALTVSIVRGTTLGTATVTGRAGFAGVSYLAPPTKGTDLLTTQVSDGTDLSPMALSTILLTNQPPSVTPASISVTAGTTYSRAISATDLDFDPLTFQVLQQPTIGTLSFDGSSGNFTLAAPAGASGTTSFTVQGFDQVEYSTPATITIQFVAAPPTSGTPPPTTPPPSASGGGGGALESAELLALFLLGAIQAIRGTGPGRRVPRLCALESSCGHSSSTIGRRVRTASFGRFRTGMFPWMRRQRPSDHGDSLISSLPSKSC